MNASAADTILVVRAPEAGTGTTLAITRGRLSEVVAVADADAVAHLRGPSTRIVERTGYAHPLFIDTHNHLTLTARNRLAVPMNGVTSIRDVVDRIRTRATTVPAGSWILTAADWHEQQLTEGRLPTAAELDAATTQHPVLVLRGGHNGSAGSLALALAGLGAGDGDPSGGRVERDEHGRPTGVLQDEGLTQVLRHVPPLAQDDLLTGLEAASADYLAHGIGTVRDAAVSPAEWFALDEAARTGRLAVRVRAMLMSPSSAITAAGSMAAYLDALEAQGLRPGLGTDRARVWGLKLMLDGGVEAAALREPYAGTTDDHGTLAMTVDQMTTWFTECVRRGWPFGAHAFGDAAIDAFCDAVQAVVERTGPLQPGTVVMEHGGLIDPAQLRRVSTLRIAITAQQALIDGLTRPLLAAWGRERVERLFPWRELVDSGVAVSSGTDHPIGPLDPVRGVLGMTTRGTVAGVLGAQHALTRAEALDLGTRAGAALLGEHLTGTLQAGGPADVAVYPVDLLRCTDAELQDLLPSYAMLDGVGRDLPAHR